MTVADSGHKRLWMIMESVDDRGIHRKKKKKPNKKKRQKKASKKTRQKKKRQKKRTTTNNQKEEKQTNPPSLPTKKRTKKLKETKKPSLLPKKTTKKTEKKNTKNGRSVGSRTIESVRATRGSTTQDGTDAIHGCCAMLFLFSWLQTERLSGRAVITSLVSLRSVCAVSRAVIRCVLRVLRSPEHTITTNALCVSDAASNVLSTNPKRNLSLNSILAQQTFVAKITVCRHAVSKRHSFPVLTIAVYSSYTVGSQEHQVRSSRTVLETLTFSGVSLKILLVNQSSFVSSVQVMCTCLTERQSPDLIIASRNGFRSIGLWWPPGQPQRCSTLL